MSHSIPPNPSSRRDEPRYDEWIAVLVALLTMGGILFWIVGRDAKLGKQKFASPNALPAPEATVSDHFNLSKALEESLIGSRGRASLPQPISVPDGSSVSFPSQNNITSDSPSTDVNPVWGFAPFFFAPKDEAAQPDTETEQAAQPDTEAEQAAQPDTEAEQAAQPDTEAEQAAKPDTEAEQAAKPDTEAEQAAKPDTEAEQAAKPDTEAEQAAKPDTEAEQAAKPDTETEQAAQPDTETEQAAQPDTEAEQAAKPDTEAEQAAKPDTEAEQAAKPDTEAEQAAKPEEETATQLPVIVIPDVSEDYWAEDFIAYTTGNEIVNPYPDGTFKPDQAVTRAEFAAQLENAFVPKRDLPGQPGYKDVDESTSAEQAITDVTKTGFMTGYPGDIFRPEQSIPRVQVLVALASGLDLKPPRNPEKILQEAFTDADQIPAWAVDQVAAATQAGLVVNHPEIKTLNPNEPATRAEVSAMIYQALVESGETEAIPSDYIVKPEKGGILPF